MDVKNTSLLFQQELNTYYKDILNCEITHPDYWAWKVPETFFLRKRKWIDVYHDWWWDEVLDYIEFDWEEYAIVKQWNYIQIKKWVWAAEEWLVANTETYQRKFSPSINAYFKWSVSNEELVTQYISVDWYTLYAFITADYKELETTTKELFLVEYWLDVPNNINYIYYKNAVRLSQLSWLIDWWNVRWLFSNDWNNLFIFLWSKLKFVQLSLWVAWNISTIKDYYVESEVEAPEWFKFVSDVEIDSTSTKLFAISSSSWVWWIYELSFKFNNIDLENKQEYHTFLLQWAEVNFTWISFWHWWNNLYLVYNNTVYQIWWSWYNISSFSTLKSQKVLSPAPWLNAWTLDISEDWVSFIYNFNNSTLYEWQYPTSTILTSQNYNSKVNHSFKRQFQSVKWIIKAWNWKTTTCTWSIDTTKEIYKITLSWVTMTENEFAWCYIYITEGQWVWQILNISANTTSYLTVSSFIVTPSSSKYIIFDQYWEVLSFIWWDWLYAIHTDNTIIRWNSFINSVATVDACWNNGRAFMLNTNWQVFVSAYATENFWDPIYWWQMAWVFNSTSNVWSVVWWLRIVPFNSIVLVFTNTQINIIKQESLTINSTTFPTYKMDLAVWFLWLHSSNALYSYNTWIYFISNKNTFLSLNIEENYLNKYKVTTEDLWVDIQQWMDWINKSDKISLWIDEETIYITWNSKDKSTIFQYDTFFKFRHRRETYIQINHINVSNNVTYLWPVCYRYNLRWVKNDWWFEYDQHLRWFNWDDSIFSLKTILYHKLYLWQETDLNSSVTYKARLSDLVYDYNIPLNWVQFLQKLSNYDDSWILWKWILWITPLWWDNEWKLSKSYISDVDILEIPLWLTYSLLEIVIEWDFETGGNILWSFVHDPHLTPYEDVVPYLYDI